MGRVPVDPGGRGVDSGAPPWPGAGAPFSRVPVPLRPIPVCVPRSVPLPSIPTSSGLGAPATPRARRPLLISLVTRPRGGVEVTSFPTGRSGRGPGVWGWRGWSGGTEHGRGHHYRGGEAQDPGAAAAGGRCGGAGGTAAAGGRSRAPQPRAGTAGPPRGGRAGWVARPGPGDVPSRGSASEMPTRAEVSAGTGALPLCPWLSLGPWVPSVVQTRGRGNRLVVVSLLPVSRDRQQQEGARPGEAEVPAILRGPEPGAARVRWKE